MNSVIPTDDHHAFIRMAALFEAALALLAIGIGWLVDIKPDLSYPGWRPFAIGVAATIPMIGFYYVISWLPIPSLQRIQDLLLDTLGRPLSRCQWHELLLLAAMAGICEELLFRGVVQPWLAQWGTTIGWVGTNILFGLAHAVTPAYFVVASLMGGYLSATDAVGQSLYAPILTHTLYDWFAFAQIAKAYRNRPAAPDHSDDKSRRSAPANNPPSIAESATQPPETRPENDPGDG